MTFTGKTEDPTINVSAFKANGVRGKQSSSGGTNFRASDKSGVPRYVADHPLERSLSASLLDRLLAEIAIWRVNLGAFSTENLPRLSIKTHGSRELLGGQPAALSVVLLPWKVA